MTPHFLSTLLPDLRYRLLIAASGKHHLADTGRAALAYGETDPESAPLLASLAKELFTAAWLTDPLDGTLAADLAEFDRRLPGLTPQGAKCVKTTAGLCRVPEGGVVPPRLVALEASGAYAPLCRWLERELQIAPGNGFLAWSLYHHALRNGDFKQALDVAARFSNMPVLAPVVAKLSADAHFLAGEYDRAVSGYAQVEQAFPGLCADRFGEALCRAGRVEEGLACLRRGVENNPWMVNAALRLHDLSSGIADARGHLPGRTAILLYSYNNAAQLDLTLHSLHQSLLDEKAEVLVRVLSNGSVDGTNEVIGKWRDRFGDFFEGVFLPVNVGAPAARNWLISLPEVRACDHIAYLDDDVRLPAAWLSRFGAAVSAYPDAALWGCRVADYERVANLQQVDLNILPSSGEGVPFQMSEAHLSAHDFGQFSYLRPAGAVTGCCHLFRAEALLGSGGFDIRFSPSQYDDLDHDLRLSLAGKKIVYQGHLAVEHMKVSGRSVAVDPVSAGSAAGNLRKLQSKYSEKETGILREKSLGVMEKDFYAKLECLAASRDD